MRTKLKIPISFNLFATEIQIFWDNKYCNDKKIYGEANYSQSKITLSNIDGLEPLSEGRMIDTFYHEKVHTILDAMSERELSSNEKFVDIFAKILRQSDETSVFINECGQEC